jgi:hypothetical protein
MTVATRGHLGSQRFFYLPDVNIARAAVDGHEFTLVYLVAAYFKVALLFINVDRSASSNAAGPPFRGDDRSVGGTASAGRQDAL